MKILVINGPNLNLLGKRDPLHYGSVTLEKISTGLAKLAKAQHITVKFFQSNHEGGIIDFLQNNLAKTDGVIINPGALTHYGYSLRDALADMRLPIVEVHLSRVEKREPFRRIDALDGIVIKKISGLKEKSYYEGFKYLVKHLNSLL